MKKKFKNDEKKKDNMIYNGNKETENNFDNKMFTNLKKDKLHKNNDSLMNIPKSLWIILSIIVLYFSSRLLNFSSSYSSFLFLGFLIKNSILSSIIQILLIALLVFLIYGVLFYKTRTTFYLLISFFGYKIIDVFIELIKMFKLGQITNGFNLSYLFYFIFLIILFINLIYLKFYLTNDSLRYINHRKLKNKKKDSIKNNNDDSKNYQKSSFKFDNVFFYLEILLIAFILISVFLEALNFERSIMKYNNETEKLNITQSINYCNNIQNKNFQSICFSTLINNKFNNTNYTINDLSKICFNIKSNYFINKNLCFIQLANIRHSLKPCNFIVLNNKSNENKWLKLYCIATTAKNISLCSKINNTNIKNACYMYINDK